MNFLKSDTHPLVKLRNKAFEASSKSHAEMKHAWELYNNSDEYGDKTFEDPAITDAIDRLIPVFTQGLSKVKVEPDKSNMTQYDAPLVDMLDRFLRSHEEADMESERIRTIVTQFLVMGNTVSKVVPNHRTGVVTAPALSPMSVAFDPSADHSIPESDYTVHTTYQAEYYIKRKFPDITLDRSRYGRKNKHGSYSDRHRLDEIWMTSETAKENGVKCDVKKHNQVLVKMINDQPIKAITNPIRYPAPPFALSKVFVDLKLGSTQSMWGTSHTSKMEGAALVYNRVLTDYMDIVRNVKFDRVITTEGTLDNETILNVHGANIKLNENKEIGRDFQTMPPPTVSPAFIQSVATARDILQNKVPSLQPVFIGEGHGANQSGRAILAQQHNSINQVTHQILALNEFMRYRTYIRLNLIQQFAKRPNSPNMWRLGLDLPDMLPEDARFIGYNVLIPDASLGLPDTLLGRIQVLQILNSVGYALTPERTNEFLKLDTTFGFQNNDLISLNDPTGGSGIPIDESTIAGIPSDQRTTV